MSEREALWPVIRFSPALSQQRRYVGLIGWPWGDFPRREERDFPGRFPTASAPSPREALILSSELPLLPKQTQNSQVKSASSRWGHIPGGGRGELPFLGLSKEAAIASSPTLHCIISDHPGAEGPTGFHLQPRVFPVQGWAWGRHDGAHTTHGDLSHRHILHPHLCPDSW